MERERKVKRLAALLTGKSSTASKSPEIYREELGKEVEEIIEEEAKRLYLKVTGRRKIPKEGVPQEFRDKALIDVLERYQTTLREIQEIVPRAAPPLERKYVEKGIPLCPKCGVPMKPLVGKLYQCPQCYRTMRFV